MKIAQVLTASTGGIGRHVASIAPRMVPAAIGADLLPGGDGACSAVC